MKEKTKPPIVFSGSEGRRSLDRIWNSRVEGGYWETTALGEHGESYALRIDMDSILLYFKFYELTHNEECLAEGVKFVQDRSINYKDGKVWKFATKIDSPALETMPPDADTTAYSLMLLLLQKNKKDSADITLEPFDSIKAEGGINLFFGPRESDQVDPAINCGLAILQLKLGRRGQLFDHVRSYLNKLIDNMDNGKQLSHWYTSNYFIYYRLAEIFSMAEDYLTKESVEKLKNQLRRKRPESALDRAWACLAFFKLGCETEAYDLFEDIVSNYNVDNSSWGFDTFYIQNNPKFKYGSEYITSIYSLEALSNFDNDFKE